MNSDALILIAGATGYVGGELRKCLRMSGRRLRCLARKPEVADGAADTEIVKGDVLDRASLESAMAGVHTAYYLVHSMGSSGSFEEEDRRAARNFGDAAQAAGVLRIVYLGGLGDSSEELSAHLRSRHEVGKVLRSSGVPVVEFRASVVIGAGSLSFEMVRALVERLPIMIAPRWVSVPSQPIAIRDLLKYLSAALDLPDGESRVYEIGGADRVSYGDLMREYALQRGLKRWVIAVPVLTPRLSSLWLGLVTPLYVRVGRKLIDSICHPTVVTDHSAADAFPIRPMGYRDAIRTALEDEDRQYANRPWPGRAGSRMFDSRTQRVDAPAASVFRVIERIGGHTGWYYGDWLWRVRGALDRLVGGIGLRKGRRHPDELQIGDIVDCWRVELFEPNRLLRLVAEMKLAGRAWLEFEVEGNGATCLVRQTALYDPKGLLGRAYWYVVLPLHNLVFQGMLRGIAERGRRSDSDTRQRSGN